MKWSEAAEQQKGKKNSQKKGVEEQE